MTTAARLTALALCLSFAAPVMAAPLSEAEIGTVLERAMTPMGDRCHESWDEGAKDSPDQVIVKCQAAIAEIKALRAKEGKLSIGVRTLYAGTEAMLEQGIALAYTRKGTTFKAATCQHEERIWSLLDQNDLTSVSPEIAKTMTEYKDLTSQVVKQCRTQFGTPTGAPKLPPAPAATN